MARKYEVYIDGKPFVIGERPDPRAVPDHWLAVEVHAAAELAHLSGELLRSRTVQGVHVFNKDVEELWGWFRNGYRFVQAAGGTVTDERGRLLAIHRLGVWDLPKGKVEKGEDIPAAAVREVEEECGLKRVTLEGPLCATWHTYERDGHPHLKRTDWFLMRASSAEELVAQHEEDIQDVRWMDAAGVADMKRGTYPSLRPVISAWEAACRDRG